MAERQSKVIGRTIKTVRSMTKKELDAEGWEVGRHGKPSVIVLDDGTKLYASRDPEGNGPGALFGVDAEGQSFMW